MTSLVGTAGSAGFATSTTAGVGCAGGTGGTCAAAIPRTLIHANVSASMGKARTISGKGMAAS